MKANSYYSTTRRIEWWLWGCKSEEEYNRRIKSLKEQKFKFTEQQLEERRKKRDLIGFLSCDANFATGTFTKSGVTIHRGEVKRTIRELSLILQIPRTTIIRYLKELKELGLISIRRENRQTIITLHFYPKKSEESQETQSVDTSEAKSWTPESQNRGHQKSSVHEHQNPNDKPKENQGVKEQRRVSTEKAMDTQNYQSVDTKNGESWTPKSQNRGHMNNKNYKEEKEILEEKEQNNTHTENNSAPPQNSGSDSEEGKKIDRGIVERLAEEVIREFKLEFKRRYNRYPIVSNKSRKLLVENLSGAQNLEELQDTVKTLIENIPNYFTMNDTWVKKQGYSFFAFCHRLEELTALPDTTIHVNFGWSREKEVGEVTAW